MFLRADKITEIVFQHRHGVVLMDYYEELKTITGACNTTLCEKTEDRSYGKTAFANQKCCSNNAPSPILPLAIAKNYELRFELNCLFFLRKHYIRTPKMTLEKKSISGAKTNIRS